MPNINAALLLAQLEKIDEKIQLKRNLFNKYFNNFKNFDGLKILSEPKNCFSNYWLQTLILDKHKEIYKEKILQLTNKNNIGTRPVWDIIPTMKPYKKFSSDDLSCSKSLYKKIINLPSNVKF